MKFLLPFLLYCLVYCEDTPEETEQPGLNVSQAIALDVRVSEGADYFASIRWQFRQSYGYELPRQLEERPMLRGSFGPSVERDDSKIEMAVPAACLPELTTVPIHLDNITAGSIVLPDCTRVERCGGCCSHPLLSCQATEVEDLAMEVLVIDLEAGEDRREIVRLERHNACACQCTTKEHHCNQLQDYKEEECRCECKNTISQMECRGQHKLWDGAGCVCRCINAGVPCSTGLIFSHENCRCEREDTDFEPTHRPPAHGRPRSRS